MGRLPLGCILSCKSVHRSCKTVQTAMQKGASGYAKGVHMVCKRGAHGYASGTNELYCGDNLDVLRRKIASESVDLCYIDPPFNSKRSYFQIYNNQGGEDRAQAQAFVDSWNLGDEAFEGLDYILDIERLNPRAGDTR